MCAEEEWRAWLLRRACVLCRCATDAEDLVQEVLIAFWQKHSHILPWDYHDEAEAKRHCLRLLRDKHAEHSRRLACQREVLWGDLRIEPEADVGQMEQDVVEQAYCVAILERLEGILSPRQRQILVLLGQGLTYVEIAETIGISEGAVKSQIYRIRAKAKAL